LSIDIDQTVEPIRTEKSQQRKENTEIIGTSNTQTNIVITTEQIQPEPIPNTEDHKIKLKELRQLEQRWRKMRSSFSRVGQLFSSFLGILWKFPPSP
jgi:hypothetical protein